MSVSQAQRQHFQSQWLGTRKVREAAVDSSVSPSSQLLLLSSLCLFSSVYMLAHGPLTSDYIRPNSHCRIELWLASKEYRIAHSSPLICHAEINTCCIEK